MIVDTPTNGGIREIIPKKFQGKYQKWKDELLSSEAGREQWNAYLNNKNFVLTITVALRESVV